MITYTFYAVLINIENSRRMLSYEIVNEVLGALGAFLQGYRMSEAVFELTEREQDGEWRGVGTGWIERDPFSRGGGNGTGGVV